MKTKCPLCDKELILEPHPTAPGRLVAKCNCRGKLTEVIDMPQPAHSEVASKPTKAFPSFNKETKE